jgi:predicted amidophosphoribosyltransferase
MRNISDSDSGIFVLCPSCGSKVPYQLKRCPQCGYSLSASENHLIYLINDFIIVIKSKIIHFFQKIKPKSGAENKLYQNLLRKTRFDRNLTERLIEYEHEKNPSAKRIDLIKDAIERWERDNH